MRIVRDALILWFVVLLFAVGVSPQDQPKVPSASEIQELLTEVETAWQQFRPLFNQQRELLAKSRNTAPDGYLRTYPLDAAVPMMKYRPLSFNGPDGFLLFQWLSDASRTAALCANTSSAQARIPSAASKSDLADDFNRLGKGCLDASTSLYSVSQKTAALYLRYLNSEQERRQSSAGATQKLKS